MGTILAEVVDTGSRDARGRRMLSVVQRAEYVRAYHASGLNQAAFAKREGLRYSTFCHWVQKAARGELRAPTTPAAPNDLSDIRESLARIEAGLLRITAAPASPAKSAATAGKPAPATSGKSGGKPAPKATEPNPFAYP